MNLLGSLTRAVVIAGVLSTGSMPALAGPAEIAALEPYIGSWSGKGNITGGESQPVTCRMNVTKGNAGKLNYTGRCSIAGNQLSVTGTIAYVDANRRYEAVMNSGVGGFRGVAIGRKSGDRITFDLQQRADDDQGNDITISSSVVLANNQIRVDFHATFNDSGEKVDANIPFSKA